MATKAAVLEIQDAEIRFKRTSGELHVEPGFALVDRGEVLVGAPARGAARLRPRDLHTRFWSELSLDPLTRPGPTARTTADLAFAQLSSVWNTAGAGVTEVVLAIPAQLSREKLGLLLGIAQECSIPVCGMVGTPLLSAPHPEPERHLLYLDVGLHEAVVTQIDQVGGAGVAGFDTVVGAGLLAFEERWIQRVAAAFLAQTRFDPLHQGATEQLLYDQLPAWIGALHSAPRVECALRFGEHSYTCSVPRSELVAAGQTLCDAIADLVGRASEPPVSLHVSHRLASIPGLAQMPQVEVTAMEISAPLDRALRRIDEIRSPADGVLLTTRLAWSEAPLAPVSRVAEPEPARPTPTHVVFRGLAHPIGPGPFTVGRDPDASLVLPGGARGLLPLHFALVRRGASLVLEVSAGATVQHNNVSIDSDTRLEIGDRLEVGEPPLELSLVALAGVDGA